MLQARMEAGSQGAKCNRLGMGHAWQFVSANIWAACLPSDVLGVQASNNGIRRQRCNFRQPHHYEQPQHPSWSYSCRQPRHHQYPCSVSQHLKERRCQFPHVDSHHQEASSSCLPLSIQVCAQQLFHMPLVTAAGLLRLACDMPPPWVSLAPASCMCPPYALPPTPFALDVCLHTGCAPSSVPWANRGLELAFGAVGVAVGLYLWCVCGTEWCSV